MENKAYPEGINNSDNNTSNEATTMYEDQSNYEAAYNKILLIEDNPGDARLVELLLGESDLLNCRITNKTTLAEGIRILEEEGDYAAVLLDLTLPDSRGFETLEQLLDRCPDNNVIVLTGLSDKSLGVKAVKAGAQDFLIKGAFDADLLAKSLRYSIERNSVLQRLEETQRIARIGNWEYIPVTKEFTASDEVYRIFGVSPRKTANSLEELQDFSCPFSLFNEIHEETIINKVVKRDVKIQGADGQLRFSFIECRANKNAENHLVLTGIIQDITERKLAEQELRKSQERYQDIFSKSKDAIFICNLGGMLEDYNQSTVRLLGYPKEELASLNVYRLFQPEEQRHLFLQKLRTEENIKDFEIEIHSKEEKVRYCLITANKVTVDNFEGYSVIVRDITENKQAEELRKARDIAQQSAKMKEQFIASVSHEMRTPMNAVLGMSNLMIKTELGKEQKNLINSIKQSSEILLGIINDILEISTIQNGKLAFEHADFDLKELLDNLVNVMQYKINEKDLAFTLEIDPEVPQFIKGDKLRLNQILYNLVGNAVKFTDHGHIAVRVKHWSSINDSVQIKFEVEDSGIGIPEDKLDAIFETFTRIRSKERLYEGTGLGLSIAKNLVDQQGGRINATSKLGEGSTFFFDLVFELGNESDIGSNNIEDEKMEELNQERPLRLLLVEDHKMNQIVARKTLERQWESIEVTIADNGKIAIEILEKERFDIILMDIQMPIMDGYETTDYIRKNMPKEIATMPILAMTAHAHIAKDEKFKEYGMDDFVLKPFEPEQLFHKIAKYVNQNNRPNE